MIELFREQIRAAAAEGRALCIRGGGSKDWYGQRSEDHDVLNTVSTRAHSGVIDYEPSELVITACSGTPLAEIEGLLAGHDQMLAFEPPHFGPHATLGGAIAAGLSGPRRATAGALRDFVLGCSLMDGRGEVLQFGGQVMKNVAGYDVSRVLAGSLGTLGLMLQHSVKVLPRPVAELTLWFEIDEIGALRRLNEWAGKPLPLSASCWVDGVLQLRLSGAEAAVKAAREQLGGEPVAGADEFWRDLREQRHWFFAGPVALWRLSLPSTASALIVGAPQLIEWGGAQRWLKLDLDADGARRLRQAVASAGGHATLFRGGDQKVGVFHPLAPAIAKIHQRLKAEFDPAGVFNPGRMY